MTIRLGRSPRPGSACYSADVLTPTEKAAELAIKRELEMNYQRYQQVESGLSSIAKKVLSYVPLGECWKRARIATEIERQSRARVDPRTLDGVLASLVECGLVKEATRGEFRRVAPPEAHKPVLSLSDSDASKQDSPKPQEKKMPVTTSIAKPIDKIASATSKLRTLAKQINDAANEIEDAALAEQQESQKMRQLSELLKSINT